MQLSNIEMAEDSIVTDCLKHAHDGYTTERNFINGKDGPAEEKPFCSLLNAVSVS